MANLDSVAGVGDGNADKDWRVDLKNVLHKGGNLQFGPIDSLFLPFKGVCKSSEFLVDASLKFSNQINESYESRNKELLETYRQENDAVAKATLLDELQKEGVRKYEDNKVGREAVIQMMNKGMNAIIALGTTVIVLAAGTIVLIAQSNQKD